MPEMPEVEITKRILEKQLKFLKICKIQIFKKELRWIIKNELKKLFLDCIILKPFRLGKYIIIPTNKNICLIIHLGMSGVLKIKICVIASTRSNFDFKLIFFFEYFFIIF